MPDKKKRKSMGNKRNFPVDAGDVACHLCGGRDFEWGRVSGAVYQKKFKLFEWRIIPDFDRVRARICLQCGNMQTFIEGN